MGAPVKKPEEPKENVRRDLKVDKTRDLIIQCMDLISKRNGLISQVIEMDEMIDSLMFEIKKDPNAEEIKNMLEGMIKQPTKRG